MEFFERIEQIGHLRPSPVERATKMLAELAEALAEAPEPADIESGTYGALYGQRLLRANRAYARGLEAIARDDADFCIAKAESGLLHLELALHHVRTTQTPLSAGQLEVLQFEGGGCEELITRLSDAICRIKQFVEYKGIVPTKSLKDRLAKVVQSLQDSIENYARADHSTALDIATIGLLWSQYIYARLSADTLTAPLQQPRRLRSLYHFAQVAGEAGSEPVCLHSVEGQEKIKNLEAFLQSSIIAYFDNDIAEMDKFIQLGGIEAGALAKYAVKMKNRSLAEAQLEAEPGLVEAAQAALAAATADDGMEASPEKGSFKRITLAIRRLIESYHPKPHKGLVALRELQSSSIALRKAMRMESWQEASRLLEICQAEKAILLREIQKMTD